MKQLKSINAILILLLSLITVSGYIYYRFTLSYRDIDLIMMQKGISVTYESIRYWCMKFGRLYTNSKLFIDKLKSYMKPVKTLLSTTPHITQQYANSRAENSHQPTRLREKKCVDLNH